VTGFACAIGRSTVKIDSSLMRNPLRPPSTQPDSQLQAVDSLVSSATASSSALSHCLSVVLIVAAVVILFWRVFLLGETLIDVSTLNNQLPWGYYAQQSDYPYDRRDPTDMYITRDYFVVQSYRDGELPLWNPYTMAGHPIYADGVTRIFSPSLLFYKFLDVPLGYSVARLVELCLGAIFLYAFLVGVGVRAQGALLGALVFAFSSHSMLHLVGLGWWGGLMWLPLILLLVDRAIRSGSFAYATMAGIVLAVQIYCGYMANEIYYLGAIAVYYLFFGMRGRSPVISRARALGMIVLTAIVGLSLSAPVWIPVLEQLKYSNRLIVPTQTSYIYLPPWYLATLVWPDILGAPYDARFVTLFQAINVSHDHSLYMGMAALAAFGFCLLSLVRWRGERGRGSNGSASDSRSGPATEATATEPSFGYERLRFFVLFFALGIVIISTAPVYVHLTRFIPVLQTIRVIMRAGVLVIFSASVLAAFGCQLLLDAPDRMVLDYFRLTRRFVYILCGLLAIGTAAAYAIRAAGLQGPQEGRGKLAFIRKTAGLLSTQFTPPSMGILIPVALALTIAVFVYLAGSGRLSRRALYAVMIGLLVVDLFWNSRNFEHSYDRSRVYPETQVTNRLAQLPPGRVLPTPSDLDMNRRTGEISSREKIVTPPNTLLPYRVPTVTGKDQIFPKWYRDFASLIEPQPHMSHVVFDRNQSPFLDLVDTRYILTRASAGAPAGAELIETAEGLSLYRNPSALPRTFFAPRVQIVDGEAEALSIMLQPGFDPARTVVLDDPDGSAAISQVPSGDSAGTATVTRDRRNSVQISTESETGGALFLSDTYYPGWIATIDGAPARIYRADIAFRAVRVPAGRHIVEYVFAPRSFRMSWYGAAAGVLIAIAGLALGRRRDRTGAWTLSE
jgi:hypothetical protein